MATGDEVLPLIIAVSEMANTIAKNLIKILKKKKKKSRRLKSNTTITETTITNE